MGKIKLLSKDLINKIAAGEVVERPASAVKELIENSIDAKSTRIQVYIEEGGLKLIRIKDDGEGMDKEDAIMAFTQHATSKVQKAEDLNSIYTLGFRGEALASIAAVSAMVKLLSKQENINGVEIVLKEGIIAQAQENKKIAEKGTDISIYELFGNIPARKKFLKSEATETKNIINTFLNTALPYLDIAFDLFIDNKKIYQLTKTSSFKNRLFEIYGKDIAENILEGGEKDNILYLIGKPEIAKKFPNLQHFYINNRFFINKAFSSAVNKGFSGFIHTDLKPTFLILIHINPQEVDVNVHPRKQEVRFNNEGELFKKLMFGASNILENWTKSELKNSLSRKDYSHIQTDSQPNNNYSKPISKNYYSDKPFYSKQNQVKQALNFTSALLSNLPTTEVVNDLPRSSTINAISSTIQIFNTYIVFENDNNLIVIDQHAAAEKIKFEKLIQEHKHVNTKPLLLPQIYELKNNAELNIIKSKFEDFKKVGILMEEFGEKTIRLTEIPEILSELPLHEYIDAIIQGDSTLDSEFLENKSAYPELTKETYLLIATAACHSSIRAGQALNHEERLSIVKSLLELEDPYNCPHGRPTMWKLSKYQLEKNFKRDL